MINVDWKKIKPYEKPEFAIPVITVLLIVLLVGVVIAFVNPLIYMPLKVLTAVFVFLTVAFGVHIESRMLQIYMLLGVIDISMLAAVLMPFPAGLTVFFFVVSLLAALASAGVAVFGSVFFTKDTLYDFPEANRKNVFGSKNVMLFAPHEDDEINIYGGIIEQYVKNGSKVRIVFSTNGDYYKLGKLRIKEALSVAKTYGIDAGDIIFLGFSDSITDKNGLHIYNAPDDVVLTSCAGYDKTYGTANKKPFAQCDFTRKNYLNAFINVIEKYKPDTIFCCDYDGHADHRAISLFFEEALGDILKRNPLYKPLVFKGFAYSTAWDGAHDYYSLNALSTRLKEPSNLMSETNTYLWNQRVRFPVAKESLSRVMQNSSGYRAMQEYSSQTATDHANGIINSDKVFWLRRTDSVLLNAEITATSGDASHLADFKLVDSDDIKNDTGLPLKGLWRADADDEKRIVAFKLPVRQKICRVVIYEDPSRQSHIINAQLMLGRVSYNTGELNNGGPTVFEFPPVDTDIIGIRIKSCSGECAILKVEAFTQPESDKAEFIKTQNSNGDFCYDYIVNKSGREQFSVYTFPNQKDFDFTAESSDEGVICSVENNVINVYCPEGEQAVITVRAKDDPNIYDCFAVRNPDERERYILSFKQNNEQKMWSFSMQWDYYRGLLRRLGVFKPKNKNKQNDKQQ